MSSNNSGGGEKRPDRPVWVSSRLAARRQEQQQQQQQQQQHDEQAKRMTATPTPTSLSSSKPTGSGASRWATPSLSAPHSHAQPQRTSSQPRPSAMAASSSAATTPPARSAAASRWAAAGSASSSTAAPAPAQSLSSVAVTSQHRTYLSVPNDHDPLLAAPPSPARSQLPSRSSPSASPISKNGLRPRDDSRPLGGKVDRMALLASPSRGLDAVVSVDLAQQGGTDLTDHATQVEFRAYISEQIAKRFAASRETVLPSLASESYLPPGPSPTNDPSSQRTESTTAKPAQSSSAKREEVEQVMLLVRKLREGCVASGRLDAFTLDVYELSVYLTLLCLNIPQLASSLGRLVLDLYPAILISSPCAQPSSSVGPTALADVEHIGRIDLPSSSPSPSTLSPTDVLNQRAHLSSLLLLRTLCLSSHASRLGQYTSPPSATSSAPQGSASLNFSLEDFAALRTSVHASLLIQATSISLAVLSDEAKGYLDTADRVYRIVRDTDVFGLHRILSMHSSRDGSVVALTTWQRMLVLHLVPVMREAAWKTIRKAYMHVPVPREVAMLKDSRETTRQTTTKQEAASKWTTTVLLLDQDILPASASSEDGQDAVESTTLLRNRRAREETPDEWDAEGEESIDDLASRLEEATTLSPTGNTGDGRRLCAFLVGAMQGEDQVRERLVETKDGAWTVNVR